jgi:hypothetical protein
MKVMFFIKVNLPHACYIYKLATYMPHGVVVFLALRIVNINTTENGCERINFYRKD